MRLMVRDIEVANSEAEVDRVEIFERDRKERQMDNEKQAAENQRDGVPNDVTLRPTPGAGSILR
jgi:hypothetical protein